MLSVARIYDRISCSIPAIAFMPYCDPAVVMVLATSGLPTIVLRTPSCFVGGSTRQELLSAQDIPNVGYRGQLLKCGAKLGQQKHFGELPGTLGSSATNRQHNVEQLKRRAAVRQ